MCSCKRKCQTIVFIIFDVSEPWYISVDMKQKWEYLLQTLNKCML